ncbi:MAG: NUDIX domain-containing protein [Bacilli bacterium]|nr:NUDIX domain-containing protein [Bacilli bacterium]
MKETRHLGVYGLIINEDKIALILKSRGAYTGKLDLPGGSIEHGERPEETLIREIKEELNANVKEYELFDTESIVVNWTHHNEKEKMHHIGIFYKVTLENNNLKSDADGHDSLGAQWYEIADLTQDKVSPLVWIELNKLKTH